MALIDPKRGPLMAAQAAHLLQKATFGPSPAQIRQFTGMTPPAAVQALMATQPTPAPPINPTTLKPFHDLASSATLDGT